MYRRKNEKQCSAAACSYDLVAGFEDLPQLSAENNCPDFCFYLAETLMVLTIRKKHPYSGQPVCSE
ncbi:hypothetical protein [Escherichia coli]|uniref:hypothetical protein n=1 Tax=Escherichia coli TaxID=562 RepID=UPI00388DC794